MSPEPASVLQESIDQERKTFKHLLTVIYCSMAVIILTVGIGMGIVVYNSINNAPKIQCIYTFSKTAMNDVHQLLHNDRNPADYPDIVCKP